MIKLPFKLRYEIAKERIASGECTKEDKLAWVTWVLSQSTRTKLLNCAESETQ